MNTLRSLINPRTVELNTQLSDFGLHPADWSLIKGRAEKIRIQHKIEKSFYFVGSVEKVNGKRVWKTITLASL